MCAPSWFSAALLPLAAVIVTGCTGADTAPAGLSAQRAMLSEGYSLMYDDATKLKRVNLVLYVKAESQEFNDLITAISAYGGELKKDLERIARDYPGVRIDLDPLPEMERRKRFAVGMDRAFEFAPLGGRSRLDYERTMLISLSNALNHESHLCKVMAAEEPDAGLKKFLLASEKRYDELYRLAIGLLVREHFRPGAKS
jgi:hypothetical protein